MSQQIPKNLLFYSNYCESCKNLLEVILRKKLREEFMLICLDGGKYKIPACVNRVPTIITKKGDILYENGIIEFIEYLSPDVRDVLPYPLMNSFNSFSVNYGLLDENEKDIGKKEFTFVGTNTDSIMTPEDTRSGMKLDNSMLEKYMAERDKDIQKIINSGK